MPLKYCKPFKNAQPWNMTQGFHKDHQANDFAGSYGEFLCAPFNAKVVNVRAPENLDGLIDDLQNGCGIRLQSVEDSTVSISYWHTLPVFPVKKGDTVIMGQPVAQMGNTGFVMSGSEIVTVDKKLTPPYKGTHVHITMGGTDSFGNYLPLDYSSMIDWLIPVKYDTITTIQAFLQSIINILNK